MERTQFLEGCISLEICQKKPNLEDSTDTSILLNKPLNNCGKCTLLNVKLFNVIYVVHGYIVTLSPKQPCQIQDCLNRTKSILNDWIISHDSSNIKRTVAGLTKEYLSTEHQVLQKAITNLSTKIDTFTAQETELNTQITETSKLYIYIQPKSSQTSFQLSDRKSNVVVCGVEESPPNTPRGARLQKGTVAVSKIFESKNIEIKPSQILECYRLGKYKLIQPRPRPILVKLQRAIDILSILANRTVLKSPVFIRPDLSPSEQKVESILLKE